MKMRQLTYLLIVFTGLSLIVLIPGHVSGQYGAFGLTDARQLALGNTYATNSRELYAAGKNTSLMAETRYDRKLSILFPNLSSSEYNINATIGFFNDFFGRKPLEIITNLDGSLIEKALQSGGKLYLGLQIGYMALGYYHLDKVGAFSFAMKDYLASQLQLPRTVVNLNESDKRFDYLIGLKDFSFSAQWMRAYELNYARAFNLENAHGIRKIYAGIGVKYFQGFIYNEIGLTSGVGYSTQDKLLSGTFSARFLSSLSDDINIGGIFNASDQAIDHVPFMKPAGKGVGFDAGITVLIGPGVKTGISVSDIGTIRWEGQARKIEVEGEIDIDKTISLPEIDSILNSIHVVNEIKGSFRTSPPTALHIGLGIQVDHFVSDFPGEMNIALEIHNGLNDHGLNQDYPRLAAGLDWKPGRRWPVFLTGVTHSTYNGVMWSLGLGYELPFAEIYIASPDLIQYFDEEDLSSISVSICWHFVKDRKESISGSIGKVREKKKKQPVN